MHHEQSKNLSPQSQAEQILQLERRASELRRIAMQALNALRMAGHDKLADELLEKMVGPAEIKKDSRG